MLNLHAFSQTAFMRDPYPYLVLESSLNAESVVALLKGSLTWSRLLVFQLKALITAKVLPTYLKRLIVLGRVEQ